MATIHGQRSHAQQVIPLQEDMQLPPSPTLTNPDLILPNETSYSTETSPQFSGFKYGPGPTDRTQNHYRSDSDGSGTEVGVATAVIVPTRLSVGPPATVAKPTHLSLYQGYEHGAPLSDIGEEETEPEDNTDGANTPKDNNRSRSPSEMDEIAAEVEKLAAPPLRHKKRLSNISVDSTDSDKAEWDKFDTTKLVSDRVAADIVQARNAADTDTVASRRNSKENDEELSILNDRAEQILENARKRLSHMEDNLSKARHSIMLSSPKSSPNMHELGLGQQPGGGLYRSISQSAANRRSRGFPVKPNTIMSHGRAGSDNVVAGGLSRQSRTPELRSVSALEYGRPWLGVTTPERLQNGHSPSSSRSFNSPLRILSEEAESPSTVRTSPGSGSTPTYAHQRGLGIHSAAVKAQEDLSQLSRNEFSGTPTSVERSNSQASTRSTRDLKDQMTEMKSRIAELKNKAQADTLRRRSVQNLRSSSPFGSPSPEGNNSQQRRSASPADYERVAPTVGHANGPDHGWRSVSQQSYRQHHRKDSALDDDSAQPRMPITPVVNRLLNVSTPAGTSSARTDRNTPNLAYKNARNDIDPPDFDSQVAHSHYEAAEQNLGGEEDEDEVFANEEEQIYLNEVLEESLHEPDLPAIPHAYLAQGGGGEERHEDRLDAFDYENMFLHSAMGTYTGRSDSDEESEADSVETSRRDTTTPIADDDSDDSDNSDQDRVLNDSDEDQSDRSSLSPTSPTSTQNSPLKRQNTITQMDQQQQRSTKAVIKVGRSNSMESSSSAATFETATEGHGRDLEDMEEEEDNDYDYGEDNDRPDNISAWATESEPRPSSPVYDSALASSPLGAAVASTYHDRHDSESTVVSNSRKIPSLTHARTQSSQVRNLPRLVGTVNQRSASAAAHYSGQPPPHPHRRSQSNDTDDATDGQTTPLASSFSHQQTGIPRSMGHHVSSSSSSSSSRHARNDSVSTVVPAMQAPSQLPRASKQSPSPQHNTSAQVHSRLPSRSGTRSQASTEARSASTASTHSSAHPANTEILMESLIKLADPSFSIRPDTRFAEIDKELVLNLLRALGGVCDGILRADKQGESVLVKELRGRLSDSEEVLFHGLGGDDEDEEISDEQNQSSQDDTEDEVSNDDRTMTGLGIEGAVHHR